MNQEKICKDLNMIVKSEYVLLKIIILAGIIFYSLTGLCNISEEDFVNRNTLDVEKLENMVEKIENEKVFDVVIGYLPLM